MVGHLIGYSLIYEMSKMHVRLILYYKQDDSGKFLTRKKQGLKNYICLQNEG